MKDTPPLDPSLKALLPSNHNRIGQSYLYNGQVHTCKIILEMEDGRVLIEKGGETVLIESVEWISKIYY